jgi:hypothetical protein
MSNISQEHRGIAKVHNICAEMDSIWRATVSSDLGIDGQIEFLEPGSSISTGQIIAVQIKSGESYFINESNGSIRYYPEQKHKRYWQKLTFPVILILHNPSSDLTVFTRVKPQLLNNYIELSLNNIFSPNSRDMLIQIFEDDIDKNEPNKILKDFIGIENGNGISGIDFLLACTNPISNYFEIRLCRIIKLLEIATNSDNIEIETESFDFILRCVTKLWLHNITEPFQKEFDYYWYDLLVIPDILVSLTTKGVGVIEELISNPEKYVSSGTYSHLGFNEVKLLVKYIIDETQKESDKLDM